MCVAWRARRAQSGVEQVPLGLYFLRGDNVYAPELPRLLPRARASFTAINSQKR